MMWPPMPNADQCTTLYPRWGRYIQFPARRTGGAWNGKDWQIRRRLPLRSHFDVVHATGGFGDRKTIFPKTVEVELDGLAYLALGFFDGVTRGNTARQIGNI